MEVILARLEHLEEVSRLFDKYRVFYQQPSDMEAAKKFLQERLQKNDSTIFLASDRGNMLGFTQLYPSFSSVSMKRVWILNDLFVEEAYRGKGVAQLLMNAAEEFARETGAVRIVLATQISNIAARSLYVSRGYIKDEDFYHYALRL
ncbi:GNAT family N-acetyltransferase [Trichocoleus sp. FACHB-591]|uniref:GNAT family N-acetyltransferase n=1 Tax=Trichocoleus sp. FACHB-591 TaxID=2692872 RepID=UPI001685693D|nr:GNAT family N-acetyltransferase [Trichocoleus sp. FACHB-591]MBD2096645.1 GNAT family N-acetyltransferase [Trichocoleus sp. FACHB-591]